MKFSAVSRCHLIKGVQRTMAVNHSSSWENGIVGLGGYSLATNIHRAIRSEKRIVLA